MSAFPDAFDADWLADDAEGRLPADETTLAAARALAFERWKERAAERGLPEPEDLSDACNFGSVSV